MDFQLAEFSPGPIVLFGSGETSPSGRKVFDSILRRMPMRPRLALLETPAGFELNSPRVIGRVVDFLVHRLKNYQPRVEIVAARKRGTPFSPDNVEIVTPLLSADLIFMGPGSPTYAVRQLRDSLAWHYLLARHRLGAALVLASAAAIALSACALPVYEIYKVGEDLHWKEGLDFFGLYGLELVFIPHWNNHEGGDELDTRHCFMGESRFTHLLEMLVPDQSMPPQADDSFRRSQAELPQLTLEQARRNWQATRDAATLHAATNNRLAPRWMPCARAARSSPLPRAA